MLSPDTKRRRVTLSERLATLMAETSTPNKSKKSKNIFSAQASPAAAGGVLPSPAHSVADCGYTLKRSYSQMAAVATVVPGGDDRVRKVLALVKVLLTGER